MSDWERCSDDPDLEEDLGYRLLEWEVIRRSGSNTQLVFLPADAEELREEAFIVAEEDAVCNLDSRT